MCWYFNKVILSDAQIDSDEQVQFKTWAFSYLLLFYTSFFFFSPLRVKILVIVR